MREMRAALGRSKGRWHASYWTRKSSKLKGGRGFSGRSAIHTSKLIGQLNQHD